MFLFDDNLDNVSLESTPSSDKETTIFSSTISTMFLFDDNLDNFRGNRTRSDRSNRR